MLKQKKETHKKEAPQYAMPLSSDLRMELFLCEEFLSLTLLNELLCKYISSSLRRLVHADTLNHLLECTGLEGCDCFLCHFLFLLNYLISR